jgi:hypothetical protein
MQGISVYDRPDRPTIYVAYDCPIRGKRVTESSGIRTDAPQARLAAYSYARERSMSGVTHGQGKDDSQWGNWVEAWLRMRFAKQVKTLTRYLGSWKFLSFWLRENKVLTPRALVYKNMVDYVLWRESQKKRSGRTVRRNTALLDVKVLSRIMREAVRQGFATGNPCFAIGDDMPAEAAKIKEEFTDADIALIRSEFKRREGLGRPSDWMPIAFEIALHQCCRLSATQIPMERIDFERRTIRFHEKGGIVFTVPMHPGIEPLLRRLRDEGRGVTCKLEPFSSRNFSRFLRSIGLAHSFHSTRVTGISRMARAGVPIQQAMAYVHHGDWAVHKIYQRLKPADVQGCHAALVFGPPGGLSGSPQISDAPGSTPTLLPASNTGPQRSALLSPQQLAAG